IRVTDSAGYTTTSSPITGSPTGPSATLTKSSQFHCNQGAHTPTSTDPSCFYFVVNTSNFVGGNYAYRCFDVLGPNYFSGPHVTSFPSNGSKQLTCYSGYDGTHTYYVVIY